MFSKYLYPSLVAVIIAASGVLSPQARGQLETGWKTHDLNRPAPKVVTPGEGGNSMKPPSDAVILFDGKNFDSWRGGVEGWRIVDGAMEFVEKAGPLMTKEEFGDCQLHLEWATPARVEGDGPQRGDSGVFLMNAFESGSIHRWLMLAVVLNSGSLTTLFFRHPGLTKTASCRNGRV